MRAKIATVADKGKNDEKAPEISVTEFASNSLFRSLSDEMEQWGLASVMMREHDAESLIEELAEGKTENPALVLVSSDRARELMASESVHFQPLFSLYHVASCTKDLMSPRRRSVSVKELSQMPIAYYNEPLINTLVKQVFGRWWPPKNIVMHSSSMTMVRKAATDGKAVMISDSFTEYLHEGEDDVMTVRIKEAFPSCFGCVTSITKPPTDAQTAFMERLSQMLLAECHSYIARYPSVIE